MASIFDDRARGNLVARLDALTPEHQAKWGRLSAHGAVCHLNDSFLGCMGEREHRQAITFLARTLLRVVAFHMPIKWPPGAKTLPEFDQERGGTPPEEFAGDVARLRDTVERFAATKGDGLVPHPFFGRLTALEWGRWGYRHMDHHLRQFGV